MSSIRSAVERANAAWLANYTVGDTRWRLRQLHGLHQLVIDHRDAIVSALAEVETSLIANFLMEPLLTDNRITSSYPSL